MESKFYPQYYPNKYNELESYQDWILFVSDSFKKYYRSCFNQNFPFFRVSKTLPKYKSLIGYY